MKQKLLFKTDTPLFVIKWNQEDHRRMTCYAMTRERAEECVVLFKKMDDAEGLKYDYEIIYYKTMDIVLGDQEEFVISELCYATKTPF